MCTNSVIYARLCTNFVAVLTQKYCVCVSSIRYMLRNCCIPSAAIAMTAITATLSSSSTTDGCVHIALYWQLLVVYSEQHWRWKANHANTFWLFLELSTQRCRRYCSLCTRAKSFPSCKTCPQYFLSCLNLSSSALRKPSIFIHVVAIDQFPHLFIYVNHSYRY